MRSSIPSVRAVTLDAGMTLIRPEPSVGHIYAAAAADYGWLGVSPEALERQFITAWEARGDFRYTLAQWQELVRATFRGLVAAPLGRAFFNDLYDRFSEPENWHIFEDVLPALETLVRRGVRLAVISNWDRRLPVVLRRLKLEPYFEEIVVSCFVRAAKPSPRIFASAARRLRLPPEAILHVGDSPRMDLEGAHRAGFQARLLRRGAPPQGPEDINSLERLCDLVSPRGPAQ